MAYGKPPWSLGEANRWLDKVGAKNLRLAARTALPAAAGLSGDVARMPKDKLGLWLVAAPRSDLAGKLWDAHAPIHRASDPAPITQWLALAPDAPMILDAVYAHQDEEYLDAVALGRLSRKTKHEP